MLDALATTELSAEQTGFVKTANSSADLLLSIIDDILDFSKIEAGKLVIEKMPVRVAAIAHHLESLYSVRAHEKQIALRCEIAEQVPACVITDPTRLTQLLSNFVGNAIKFTARGQVTICVSVLQQDASTVQLRFAVTDTGIGISQEAQRRLFTAFTQADNSTSRRFGGTGLGLAICRQLVGLLDPHEGDIGVQSVEGQGSEFYFSMRMQLADDAAPPQFGNESEPAAQLRPQYEGRVLLAEDNETNQQVGLQMLRNFGLEPVVVQDGREAVAAAQRTKFDLILMDYHMPELDGCGAALAIRAHEQSEALARSPIVAVTASVLTDDKERCARAGMDDFLAKPIRKHTLAVVLDKWLPRAPSAVGVNLQAAASEATVAKMDDELPGELFDAAQLFEMREIAGDGFGVLIKRFHASVHQSVQALRAAHQAQDAGDLQRVAHKLKGSAATLGAAALAAHCLELEMLGKSGSVNDAGALIDALVQAYLRAKPYLDDSADPRQAA
jgi:CheY-like chemotaxis protein